MRKKSLRRVIIDTIDDMLSEDNVHTVSADDILKKVYSGTPVYPKTRIAFRCNLSRYGNILRHELGYDITVIGEFYTKQRHLGLNTREQGQRCLPTCSEDNKPWGLHVRTGPNDQISNAAMDQTKSIEYGIRKTNQTTVANGLSKRTIASDIINVQERKASQRFPIPLSTTHTLLPEMVNVVGGTNVYLKWIPTRKQLNGKKDVKRDTGNGGENEEMAKG